jgi:GH43 family beta-xylosidase
MFRCLILLLLINFIFGISLSISKNANADNKTLNAFKTFKNPILPHGADPWVLKHGKHYFYTHTSGNKITLYQTKAMSQIKDSKPETIWTPPSSGMHSQQIWAPEIHYFDSKFYVYFAADAGNNDDHRIYCLENPSADPMSGTWTFKGKVFDKENDHWAIDVNVFDYQKSRYILWSGWEGDVNVAQNIYIAKMSNPWTIEGRRVLISKPEYNWETVGAPPKVNEGPEALINPSGRLFVTYSASGCWTDSYALGLLSLKEGGNPLDAKDWTKINHSVFSQDPAHGAFGTGHNGFFKSPDGKEDWIIYHANPKADQRCGDFRSPRIQKFTWNSDGTPNFGRPVAIDSPMERPSGEE